MDFCTSIFFIYLRGGSWVGSCIYIFEAIPVPCPFFSGCWVSQVNFWNLRQPLVYHLHCCLFYQLHSFCYVIDRCLMLHSNQLSLLFLDCWKKVWLVVLKIVNSFLKISYPSCESHNFPPPKPISQVAYCNLLPPFQIIRRFGFSRWYIVKAMYLEKPKHLIIWNGGSS